MNEILKSNDAAETMRLQKYLSSCGVASRRKSETLITDGRVTVNGQKVTELGTKVSADDEVAVDGVICRFDNPVYFVLYKPCGYICSVGDDYGRRTIYDLIDYTGKLMSVGRLDYESEGLIIITNDGEFANSLMHPRYGLTKQYLVVSKQPVPSVLDKSFAEGVTVDGVHYKAADIQRKRSDNERLITLCEGKKREIRNVYKHFGIEIDRLIRVKIGKMSLDELGLRSGEYRQFLPEKLKKMIF